MKVMVRLKELSSDQASRVNISVKPIPISHVGGGG